jgi:tetratricopeptide (TPR) repeat protein
VGDEAGARRSAEAALKLAPESPGVQVEATLAFALSGDGQRAEELSKNLSAKFPMDTQMQSLWLPTVGAQVALDKHDPSAAVNLLLAAKPVELALIPFSTNSSCLYAPYVRGEAYLAMGDGESATAEFQKVLDHSGLVWNCWTGALAHLGVARANTMESEKLRGVDAESARARAVIAYKDFLALWKDADPGIPILKQARAEFAKLQ